MSVETEVAALRTTTALAAGDHVACVRVRGNGGSDLLDRVSPRSLFVRPGKMSHTLFLDDDARPIADVYLCCDEDDFFVLAEGISPTGVIDFLAPHAKGLDVTFEDLTASHAMLCLGGPYSWELLGEVTTPDVIGLPYLGFYHAERFVCFRGGKTGEYGYDLLVPREELAAVRDQLATIGARFEMADISLAALEVAALENFFWNARRPHGGLTPVELQLQWRVSYEREFPGSTALAARRQSAHQRTVLVASGAPMSPNAPVMAGDTSIGTLLYADHSPSRGDYLGVAVVERALAHPGLTIAIGGVPARTISAPSIDNRSLYVDPQRHSFATRSTDAFPPIFSTQARDLPTAR